MFEKGNQLWKKARNKLKSKEIEPHKQEIDTTPLGEMLEEEPESPIYFLDGNVYMTTKICLSQDEFQKMDTVVQGRGTTHEITVQDAVKYAIEQGII